MRRSTLIGAISATALAVVVAGTFPAIAQPSGGGYGSGWMGPGMMYGNGPGGGCGPGWMGPGMMGWGGGYGPGGSWGSSQQQANVNLTVDQVKNNMERWLTATGNPHIKLGAVAEKDADTITATIVTTDKDALVQRYEVNRHTGFTQPVD